MMPTETTPRPLPEVSSQLLEEPRAAVVCFGELLVDMVGPSGFSLAETPSFLKAPGGAPANVAAGVTRLGGRGRFVGQVGHDPFGHWLRQVLEDAGVDCAFLRQSEPHRTSMAFVATRQDGLKDICFYRSADSSFEPADFDARCLDGASILHCGSVSLSLSPSREAQVLAIQEAKRRGLAISYDPNWRASIWEGQSEALDVVRSILPLADVVKIADEELQLVCGTDDIERAAREVRALGPRAVVITRGEHGAYFDAGKQRGWVAGLRAEAIDTLGAGDAFVSALLCELAQAHHESWHQLDWPRIVRLANACGALATQKRGAIPSLPTRSEAEALAAN
jgi:fructokinase